MLRISWHDKKSVIVGKTEPSAEVSPNFLALISTSSINETFRIKYENKRIFAIHSLTDYTEQSCSPTFCNFPA